MTRPDFCAFILTHRRPHNVRTIRTMLRGGYTGPYYLVVDDEDPTLPQYQERYGDRVVTFSKAEVASWTDEGINTPDRRAILYARNACFPLARQLGYRYFIQLDDDYTYFVHRFDPERRYCFLNITSLDRVFDALLEFYISTPFLSIAMSQGGDHIGGAGGRFGKDIRTVRKAMNSFICDTERPFKFAGKLNEDVNVYTELQRRGGAFLTIGQISLGQLQTQSNTGGLTEAYLDMGTYYKTFFTIMYAPSCASVSELWNPQSPGGRRIHHEIHWSRTTPMILSEEHRKPRPSTVT